MNAACSQFRARLARTLSGASDAFDWGELSWHEHLLTCEACRALLEQEQALEQLLASLPRPALPPELAARVLARLEPQRVPPGANEAALDRLLDLPTATVPQGLASGVLAGLVHARRVEREERALERLLDRVPAPEVPPDLNVDVLAALRAQRRRVLRSTLQPMAGRATPAATARGVRRPLLALAAAALLTIGLTALWLLVQPSEERDEVAQLEPVPQEPERVARGEPEQPPIALPVAIEPPTSTTAQTSTEAPADDPPEELLAALDLLESWELVTDDSLDAQLNTLDSFDELLLLIDADASEQGSDDADGAAPSAPKEG